MNRIVPLLLDALVAGLCLAWPLWRMGRAFSWSSRRRVAYLAMAVYLSIVFSLAGLPDIRYIRFRPNINLRPFRYFFSDRSSAPNVLLFVPLGMLLPTLWRRFSSGWRTVGFGLGMSLAIEVLQLFTLRATDVNDLMTNTLGTLLGWLAGRWALRHGDFHPAEGTQDLAMVCGLTFGFMTLLHPLLADPLLRLLT